ncbi:MAG: hypothetical protein ABEJ82_01085 [Haloplanus sp.]
MVDASEDAASAESRDGSDAGDDPEAEETPADLDALRERVEERYDFEDFGPSDMASMSLDEWEAAFDPETWIVGEELLDRVEADLEHRVATREVFAVVERVGEGEDDRVVAYSDEGYAVVAPDGTVEGEGTVLRDVEPTVVLCSMDTYEVPDPPADGGLPQPREVVEGTGQLGNNVLQVVAGAQLLTGVGLLVLWSFTDAVPSPRGYANLVVPTVALVFVGIALFLFTVVANARLSDRFRAEEYRNRLRALGLGEGDPPEDLRSLTGDSTAESGDSDGARDRR